MKQRNLILAFLLMLAGAESATAQKMIIKMKGSEPIKYRISQMEYVTFEEGNPSDPDKYEWVDLGLPSGTLWATTNVGAESPQDYGDYFAWGETETKEDYSWGNYLWMNKGKADWDWISKYTLADGQVSACWYDGETFIGDGKKELELDDDAAYVNWGSKWQMPSKEQFDELIDPSNTTTAWTTEEGITGLKITSLKNGESIFLPATGYCGETGTGSTGTTGNYWARTLPGFSDHAFELFIKEDNYYCYASKRYYGQSIRPVRKDHDYVDLGLPSGTMWATCNVGADSPEEFGDYFAWGETEPKSDYSLENYKYWNSTEEVYTKYYIIDETKWKFDYDELLPEDDAATANWGGNWQMPSLEQLYELKDDTYTTKTVTKLNDVDGLLVTGKNGNSIFLPFADLHRQGINLHGYYWLRKQYNDNDGFMFYIGSNEESIYDGGNKRYDGLVIRPVRKK